MDNYQGTADMLWYHSFLHSFFFLVAVQGQPYHLSYHIISYHVWLPPQYDTIRCRAAVAGDVPLKNNINQTINQTNKTKVCHRTRQRIEVLCYDFFPPSMQKTNDDDSWEYTIQIISNKAVLLCFKFPFSYYYYHPTTNPRFCFGGSSTLSHHHHQQQHLTFSFPYVYAYIYNSLPLFLSSFFPRPNFQQQKMPCPYRIFHFYSMITPIVRRPNLNGPEKQEHIMSFQHRGVYCQK